MIITPFGFPNESRLLGALLPVAQRIHRTRRARQISWGELAKACGGDAAQLRGIEEGRRVFGAAMVRRIAAALSVDEVELYPGAAPEAFWTAVSNSMRRPQAAAVARSLALAA